MVLNGAFLISALAVIITPGPDVALVSGYVLRHGRRPARAAAAGILTGGVVHASLSVLGISTLVVVSPGAYTVLRIAGAVGLCALGARTLWLVHRDTSPADERASRLSFQVARCPSAAYVSGLACNLLNAKVLLFLIVFLPQFISPGQHALDLGPPVGSLAVLAGAYLAMAGCWLCLVIELVFQLRVRLLRPRAVKVLEVLTGAALIAVGLHLGMAVEVAGITDY